MSPTKLKICTHMDNGMMYRVYWNQTAVAAHSSIISSFFFLSNFQTLTFSSHFSQGLRPTKLIFGTHVDNSLIYYQNQTAAAYSSLYFIFLSLQFSNIKYIVEKKRDAVINCCLLFPCFLSPSNVIHKEICVKDFSGTTVRRILKFGTNVGYNLLYCVQENQYAAAYYSLICPFFFSPSKFSVTNFLASMRARVFKFCIHIESGQTTKLRFILPSFIFFPSLTPM